MDNINLSEIGLEDVRKHLCIIPQDPVLFSATVRFNLDPFNESTDEEIWSVLDEVELKEVIDALPKKLDDDVHEGGSNFSVGQRQLICMARALLKKPKVLIMDEATASLDNETDAFLQKMIRKEFKNCTVLTIAHRLNTIMDSSRVCVMDKGVVAEFDTPANLLNNPETIFSGMVKAANDPTLYDMVEGYTDVISMHQCGIENVVANSGTALSVYQIRLLHRFTDNIVLLYDGDAAGIHAAMRGIDMLLAEAMKVKVLLLPGGDDPDSFARKHTAEDFRKYVADHQQDVIEFKIAYLLKGVTDPMKRSEAISSIVKSISVIQDQIVRATYLQDAAHRIGINEATLITTMNKFIRSGKEAELKEQQREQQSTPAADQPEQQTQVGPEPPMQQAKKVEYMLMQAVVRHGEQIIYDNVETADGQTMALNVAQYVSYDLGTDNLSFSVPLYNKVLQEVVDHSADPGFKAEDYLMKHPDMEISKLATEMSFDRFQLRKGAKLRTGDDVLRNQIVHLVLDFRMDVVSEKLAHLKKEISLNTGNQEKLISLIKEYQETQKLRNAIAKELGSEIII